MKKETVIEMDKPLDQKKPELKEIVVNDQSASCSDNDWQDENPFDDPEKSENDIPEKIDPVSGKPWSDVMKEEVFFQQVFVLYFQMFAGLSHMPELAVQFPNGEPEPGSRETSRIFWNFCRKYQWLNFLVDATGKFQEYQAVAFFAFGKVQIIHAYKNMPEPDKNPEEKSEKKQQPEKPVDDEKIVA